MVLNLSYNERNRALFVNNRSLLLWVAIPPRAACTVRRTWMKLTQP